MSHGSLYQLSITFANPPLEDLEDLELQRLICSAKDLMGMQELVNETQKNSGLNMENLNEQPGSPTRGAIAGDDPVSQDAEQAF